MENYYKQYQQYYAVLSGGYIYFYSDNYEDDYIAYYHLKNCILKESENDLSFKLSSNSGNIELKLSDEASYFQWIRNIQVRIEEMEKTYNSQEKEKLYQKNLQVKENKKQKYFGAEINFKKVILKLHNEENEIFIVANLTNLKANLSLRLYDNELHMEVESLTILDNLAKIKDFETILTTENKNENKNKKILDLHILICEEKSDSYKDIEIDVNLNMVYTIASYHDIGHHIDSKTHEIISADIMSKDKNLSRFFTKEELVTIKEAIEDHRASAKDDPRSIYGRIVSSADRNNKVEDCLRRTYTYGKKLNPNATDEELFLRAYDVLVNKFGEDGYAKFYFRDAQYEDFLKEIRELLKDKENYINTQREYIKKLKKDNQLK